MHFLVELARRLRKGDKYVSYVLRKERCAGSREREYLQSVHDGRAVSVTPCILHVIMYRMIISRNSLESRGVGVSERSARCAEDFSNAQVFKLSRRYYCEI